MGQHCAWNTQRLSPLQLITPQVPTGSSTHVWHLRPLSAEASSWLCMSGFICIRKLESTAFGRPLQRLQAARKTIGWLCASKPVPSRLPRTFKQAPTLIPKSSSCPFQRLFQAKPERKLYYVPPESVWAAGTSLPGSPATLWPARRQPAVESNCIGC